jgi:hypothetical protein
MRQGSVILALLCAALVLAAPAGASEWLPHPADATWLYEWTDSAYNGTPTTEKVTVKEQKGASFTLAWTTEDQGNAEDAVETAGQMVFQETSSGLLVADWSSTLPPASFPILCARQSPCGNSLSSSLYNIAWGSRTPLLTEPLLHGTAWTATGGAGNDVTSSSTYLGTENVTVPAFPMPVLAAKIRSEISQAGALGDPYGSGIRTVWWVYGVGPVKTVFEHSGGTAAPVTTVALKATSLTAKAPPPNVNWFPLRKGLKGTLRWTNKRHFAKPAVQKFEVEEVVNGSARIGVQSVSGPIKAAAAYGFTLRADGLTNIWGTSRAASLAKLPPLGPKALPAAKRRHFHTPFDLMTFGFNPLLPAYPSAGNSWVAATAGRDWSVYGVTGTTTVLGVRRVVVPAGKFSALAVRSTVRQPGFPFGSGTRTMWFAADRGLVKLEFRHGDGSVSVVELVKK